MITGIEHWFPVMVARGFDSRDRVCVATALQWQLTDRRSGMDMIRAGEYVSEAWRVELARAIREGDSIAYRNAMWALGRTVDGLPAPTSRGLDRLAFTIGGLS